MGDLTPEEPCLTYVTHHAAYDAKQCQTRGKRMTARALIKACERVVWGFVMEAPQDVSCDDYAASVMSRLNVVHPYDIVFVEQVLYGCCRYTKLLSLLMSELFKVKATTTHPQDGILFTVFGYLAFMRLEELTFANFRRLVLSQNAQKLLPFIEFVFNPQLLNQHCRAEWLKIYDIEFVDELIEGISSWAVEVADLESTLRERVVFKDPRTGRKLIPKPFTLSVCPRPKPRPKEDLPPPPFKAKPPPKFKDGPTATEKALESVSIENRKRLAEFYADPKNRPFRLRSLERPTTLEQIREEVEKRREMENQYIPAKVNKPLELPPREVKLTVAAVLREHALYQKQIDADRRRVEAFETELRDDASFKAWQDEERARVELGKALQIQFRRESVAAIGQAINEAKQAMIREKRDVAEEVRTQTQDLESKKEEFQMNLDLFNSLRRENVLQDRQAVKEALNKLAETKKSKAQEVYDKSAEFHQELAANQAMELKIKQELVQQLRALEVPAGKEIPKFDPNTIAGHGLLAEMSITELRQRLHLVKQALQREEDVRRANIVAFKKERRDNILEKSLFVRKMREITHIEQVSKREAKKKNRPGMSATLAYQEPKPVA